jgi:hypothetical protein
MRRHRAPGWFVDDPDMQLLADAPVGHRQSRADQVPSDKMDPNGIMVLKGLTLPPRE